MASHTSISGLFSALTSNVVKEYKEKEVIKIKMQDPIALFLHIRELYKGKEIHYAHTEFFSNHPKYANVVFSDETLEYAARIRKHFQSKMTIETLKSGKDISQFRKALTDLLNAEQSENGTYAIDQESKRIVVRLPDFYEEDIVYKRLAKEFLNKKRDYPFFKQEQELELRFIDKIQRTSRIGSYTRWVFADAQGHMYFINAEKSNQFLSFFDKVVTKMDKINFTSFLQVEQIQGQDVKYMYRLIGWDIKNV